MKVKLTEVAEYHDTDFDEALKDFFDLIRYLRMSNGGMGPDYFASSDMGITRKQQGGY